MSEPVMETGIVIRKTVTVNAPVDKAFRVFTDEIATWWPLEGHSVSDTEAETVVIEGRVGGRMFERSTAGEEIVWGTVQAWEPPNRFATTWHPGRDEETAQEVEVRFVAEGERTRVELEHRGWERLGDEAITKARMYDQGWEAVLEKHYAEAVG
jgi:uncharacterized protein YndB with AHSA1/START domain